MKKEDYLREKNLSEKLAEWLNACKIVMPSYRNIRFNLRESALLVLDMQRYFLDPSSYAFVPAGPYIISNVNKLISFYCNRSLPCILSRHFIKQTADSGAMGRWWSRLLFEGDSLTELDQRIVVPEGVIIMDKDKYDAFYDTGLEGILRDRSVKQVVVSGLMSHLCCESTARGAFVRDFDVFMVADAMASVNEYFHLSALMSSAHGFAMPIGTEEILSERF
jgi:isochorismate hydrolase